jgi:hypothetical protein
MGVMSCCRAGCNNIMCDTYSSVHGYICNECLIELKQFTLDCVNIDLYEFMATEKGYDDGGVNHHRIKYTDIDNIFRGAN